MTPEEELEYLRLKKRKAMAMQQPSKRQGTPDFQNGGMDLVSEGGAQTLGQMKIPGLQGYIVQNMQEQRDAEAQRKQLDQTATAAGFEARGQAAERMGVNSPLMQAAAAPALNLAQQEGGRQVFNEAGVMLPDEAAGTAILNAQAVGIPGFVSGDMRERMKQAYEDQPGWALTGEIAASVGPGEALFQGGKMAYNALAKPFVTKVLPKGGSAVARGTRFAAHGAEQTGAWAGQNAFYQATTGASSRAAQEGRAPTLADVKEGAQAGATDPINVLGPTAGIALNRIFTAARSGGRTWTPKDRADYVSGMGGKPPGSGSVLDSRMLGGDVDQRAEKIIIKMLGDAGYSRDDISRSLAAFDQLANEATDLPTLTARLKDVFIEQLGPEAENVILDFLQGAGVSRGSQAGRTMQRAADEDYGRIGQFLEDSGNARLGSGSRWDTLKGAEEEMRRIGAEQYDPIFDAAQPLADDDPLRGVLDFYAKSRFRSTLKEFSDAEMKQLDEWIQNDPRRAAHWMQSKAGQKAQEAADAGRKTDAVNWGTIRDNILQPLENSTDGYRAARLQYGDEYGVTTASTFGSRFFTKVQDTIGVKQLAEDYAALTPDQQAMARMSIRDEYQRLIGRHRSGAAPRLTQVDTDSALAGLEEVLGPEGAALANDIRYGSERLKRTQAVDNRAGPRTASNQEARQFADRAVSNPVSRTVGNALKAIGGDAANSSAFGAFAPIHTVRSLAGGLGERMARGRQGKMDDVTSLLLRDVGANPRPSMPGDVPPSATPASAPKGVGRDVSPSPRGVNALASNQSGFVRPDAASTMMTGAGATAGALNPLDLNNDGKKDWRDRAMTAALYGSGGLAARGITGAYKRGLDASVRRSVHPPASPRPRAANDMTLPRSASTAPSRPVRKVALELMDLEEARTLSFILSGEKDLAVVARDLGIDVAPGKLAKNDYLGERLRNMVERERAEALKVANESIREARGWNQKPPEKQSADVVPFKPKSSGTATFGNDLANAAVGGTVGGMGGSLSGNFKDYNEDGVLDEKDRQIGFLIGTGVGAFGAPAGTRIGVKGQRFDMKGSGPSGKLPKLMKDVPRGKPPKGGNPKLGQGNLIRQQYEGKNPPRLPEGPMTDAQIKARKAREAAMPLIEQGLSGEAIRQQTGVQTLTYKGQTVILPPYLNGVNNEAIHRFFYDSLKQPFEKRPKWVKNALRQMAGSEEDALRQQSLWDQKNPLALGTERTPMVKPGKNALSGK